MPKPFLRLSSCHLLAVVTPFLASASAAASPAVEGSTEYRIELSDPVAPSKPARTYTVNLRRDADGFPLEYSLFISTPVCMDGKCKTVGATMVWTALGYYKRLEVSPERPLTKKEHQPFDPEDYAKLDRVLGDPTSVLGGHSLAFMVKKADDADAASRHGPDTKTADGQDVDAWTGPTPVTVRQSVVEDAAYTTWVMWRWANGEIVAKVRSLTRERCTPRFVKRLLRSGDEREVDFALEYVIERCPSDGQYVDDVFGVLERGNRDQVALALRFLSGAVKDEKQLYARLAEACCRMKQARSPIVLDYFAADPDLPDSAINELTARLDRLPYFQVHLILKLLEDRRFFSRKTESDVAGLLKSDDFFIARRASGFLAKQTASAETRSQVEAFRERNRDRL
jgi:hypothetical protein